MKLLEGKVNISPEEIKLILEKFHKKPGVLIRKASKKYSLNFEEMVNEYLDYYNLIFKQSYHLHGENCTDKALLEYQEKEALYYILNYMAKKLNKKGIIAREIDDDDISQYGIGS